MAKLFGVTEDSITLWENDHSFPQIHYAPKIIRFLEFNPYFIEGTSLAVRIKNYRIKHGLSHKTMGNLLGVSGSTISSWEEGKIIPNSLNKASVEKLIKS